MLTAIVAFFAIQFAILAAAAVVVANLPTRQPQPHKPAAPFIPYAEQLTLADAECPKCIDLTCGIPAPKGGYNPAELCKYCNGNCKGV